MMHQHVSKAWSGGRSRTTSLCFLFFFASVVSWGLTACRGGLPHLSGRSAGKQSKADVSGTVIGKDGEPLAGAEVFLCYEVLLEQAHGSSEEMTSRLAGKNLTDENGRFLFEKAAVWEHQPEKPGCEFVQKYIVFARHPERGMSFAVLLEGEKTDSLKIVLGEKKTWKFRIVDIDGKAVPQAKVYFSSGDCDPWKVVGLDWAHRYVTVNSDIGLSSGVTDENGETDLPVMGGQTWFSVEKEGYAQTSFYPSARFPIRIQKGCGVYGQVTDDTGAPVPGAIVQLEYRGEDLIWDEMVRADDQGRYEFRHVPVKGYTYSWLNPAKEAKAPGIQSARALDPRAGSLFAGKWESFQAQAGERVERNIVLTRGVRLAGKVVNLDDGASAPNVLLNCYVPKTGNYLDTTEVRTDSDGLFEVIVPSGVEACFQWEESRDGEYLLDHEWLAASGHQPFREQVTADRTDLEFRVKLRKVTAVSGCARDSAGAPVAGASVYVHSEIPPAKTDKEGYFTLKAAPSDRAFDLFAMTADKGLAGRLHLEPKSTSVTLGLVPTCIYEGRVTTPDGFAASGLKFYLDLKINDSNIYRVREEPTTDADGRFKAAHLLPGATYYAWWSSDNKENRDYDWGNATVDLSTVKEGEPVAFQAKRYLNAVLGRVVDQRGKPIANAQIRTEQSNMLPQSEWQKQVQSDAAGNFSIERLAPGTVNLQFAAKGFLGKSVMTETDNVDLKVALRPASEGAQLRVAVADGAGRPAAGIPLSVCLMRYGKGGGTSETLDLTTNTEGKAEKVWPPLREGEGAQAILLCDVEGYDPKFRTVRIDADTECNLALGRSEKCWEGQVVDSEEKPLAGASVKVTATNQGGDHVFLGSFLPQERYAFSTDEQGRFRLRGFPCTDWTNIEVSAPGYALEKTYLDPKEPDSARKTLHPGGSVQCRVIGPDGKYLAEALVNLSDGRQLHQNVKTSEEGLALFDSLPAGKLTLQWHPQTEERRKLVAPGQPLKVDVRPKERTDVTLRLEEGIRVCGRVVGADAETCGHMRFSALRGQDDVASSGVKEDASWEMHLPEGEFDLTLYVYDPDTRQSQTRAIQHLKVAKGSAVEEIVVDLSEKKQGQGD